MSMKATYNGDAAVTYSQYLDATDPEAVTTLVAEPGHTYDIRPAEGHTVPGEDGQPTELTLPMPPDDNWSQAKAPAKDKKETG
jgi:hypothetical protein